MGTNEQAGSNRFAVAIIGAGPAGLSAASRAAARGMPHILLEKSAGHVSDTIFKYQKGKHVMATPSALVLRSDIHFEAGKREVVLDTWNRQIAEAGVNVRLGADVTRIEGEKGAFTLTLADKSVIEAEAVVLAIGTQGNPNLLRTPGADQGAVQYQLDDPGEYVDEHIVVIGSGDAGIENALGLAADPAQGNVVTLLNRTADFVRAKGANVAALMEARDAGRVQVLTETSPAAIEGKEIVLDTRDGQVRQRCDRVIARTGSTPPRAFVESSGIVFTSADREAFPALSPQFESTVPGIYVIGALAGYPLIKHCMNQGYDVVEFLAGNTDLKPADEPMIEARLAGLGGGRSVSEWLDFVRQRVTILNDLSPLQMREFSLDAEVRRYAAGEVVFEKNAIGSSLFGIADGKVEVLTADGGAVPIETGSIFGEVGLISGRRRGATVRVAEDAILIEIPRNAALKLIATVPPARRAIEQISIQRQLLQLFKSGLKAEDLDEVLATAEVVRARAGEVIIEEGDARRDLYVIRVGSMIVEKQIGGKPIFMNYLPAGSYFGEMALIDDRPRTATVRAAIKSELVKLDGDAFARLLARNPVLAAHTREEMAARYDITAFVEKSKGEFSGAVDLYSSVANFLVDNGIGEATDVLLIDEKLCVGCDNCEKACADSHDGLSRLDREAGRTYAHVHVPTSCRHCEHPHCMADCPPNAIQRGPDGEVSINDSCIGCGNCLRNCPYGVIRMDSVPPKKPRLVDWLFFGRGPGPGEPSKTWAKKNRKGAEVPKKAIKCDMCAGIAGGPACVRACPTGAALRVAPEDLLKVARLEREES